MSAKDFIKGDTCIAVEEYVTKNYSKFKKMEGNRTVHGVHVARLHRAFEKKYIELPLLINEKGEVCDGQTRLHVLEILGWRVRYRIIPELTLEDVQILNSNTRPWKMEDHLHSGCCFGKPDYLTVRRFWEEFPELPLGGVVMLLSGEIFTPYEVFRQGCFEVADEVKARYIALGLCELRNDYEGWHKRDFVQAVVKAIVVGGFDFDKFKAQLDIIPPRLALRDCAHTKDYLRVIEDIYNFKAKKPVRFF